MGFKLELNAVSITFLLASFFLPYALAADGNLELPTCTTKKVQKVTFDKKVKSGFINGMTFAKDRNEQCLWVGISLSVTITLFLEELDFDCSAGRLNLTFMIGATKKVDLCGIPGKKGLIGSGSGFLLNGFLPQSVGAAVKKLRLRYYVSGGEIPRLPRNGTIEAPDLPNEVFAKGYSVTWKLKRSYIESVTLTLVSMDLDFGPGCSRDVIEVETKEKTIRLCDPANETTFQVSSQFIELTFIPVKDSSKRRQFKFSYLYCSFILLVANDTRDLLVMSPFYPNPVPPNTACSWIFNKDSKHALYMKFDELVLQPKPNCSRASLKLDSWGQGEVCSSQSPPVALLQIRGTPYLKLTVGPDVRGAKFKMFATVLQMDRRISVNLTKTGKTTSFVSSPSFPGPTPMDLEMDWYLTNRGSMSVYLESFKFTPDSCDRASLVIRRIPLSAKFPRWKKVCSSTDKKMIGYLGNGFRFRLQLKTKNFSEVAFKLRIEHTDGRWSKWQDESCSVDCGYGIRRGERFCNDPKPSLPNTGCFLEDGITRAYHEKRTKECWMLSCDRVGLKESWFAVSLELEFSTHISQKLFESAVGPAIRNLTAARLTAFCNENGARCCRKSGSWKRPDPAITYPFIAASGIRFAKDTPNIRRNRLSLSFFAVPPASSALCANLQAARRRRAAEESPTPTPTSKTTPKPKPTPNPIEGALPKDVLLAAMKEIKEDEIVAVVTEALREANVTVTVSIVANVSAVGNRIPMPTKPPPTISDHYKIWVPIALCFLLIKLIYFSIKCCRNQAKKRERQNRREAAMADVPLKAAEET